MADQVREQVEYLGLNRYERSAQTQLASIYVERTIFKEVAQAGRSYAITY
jgi:hypothetical protein